LHPVNLFNPNNLTLHQQTTNLATVPTRFYKVSQTHKCPQGITNSQTHKLTRPQYQFCIFTYIITKTAFDEILSCLHICLLRLGYYYYYEKKDFMKISHFSHFGLLVKTRQ
jgi:hypothetical protein